MSQENIKVVRATFDTWNAGDMDAFRELVHHSDYFWDHAEALEAAGLRE